jgi:DNA repair protein RecO (recombination protein O)
MPIKESEAIVLRGYPLGEGDRLVSLLDRHAGRIRGVAKGARLPKSRFGSTLELLSHIRIWYFERENRELVRINQCELIESFLDVQADYKSGVCLALISEITEGVLAEREPAGAQFRLLLLTARAIRKHGASPIVIAYFCVWTARLGGWLGSFERCTQCTRLVGAEPLFASPGFAELYCADCREIRMREISKQALEVGRQALLGTLDRLFELNLSVSAFKEISSYGLDILEQHMERKLSSRKMLEARETGLS